MSKADSTPLGSVTRTAVRTSKAPEAIGPYSQALRVGSTIYTSGQIALDPASGELVAGGIEVQARQVFANLAAVLEAADASFADVVKVNVYLTDLADFATLNGIYAEYFKAPFPARATVGVAALPKGAAVEIDLVAEAGTDRG